MQDASSILVQNVEATESRNMVKDPAKHESCKPWVIH